MKQQPPILRRLSSLDAEMEGETVWEISVPSKRSFVWSIAMAYFVLADKTRNSGILEKLTGDQKELKCLLEDFQNNRKTFSLKQVKFNCISKKWKKCFNPFRNMHAVFHDKDIIAFSQIFSKHFNRFTFKHFRYGNGSYDIKLQAAAEMLECSIEVYYPEEPNREQKKYVPNKLPETVQNKNPIIVLFQYEEQELDGRKIPCIFHYAITMEYANPLKVKALRHWLKIANIPNDTIDKTASLAENPESHGENFLPTVLQSEVLHLIPKLYESPYIAFKLSAAGFETNPIKVSTDKPSAFSFAVSIGDASYVRILLEYAFNSPYLFDNKTIRGEVNGVKDTLKKVQDVLNRDKRNVYQCGFEEETKNKSLIRLDYYSLFVEYVSSIASGIIDIKNRLHQNPNKDEEISLKKEIIENCLTHYWEKFYYKSDANQFSPKMFTNYLDFLEHYENVDNFAFTCFFDNFYALKASVGCRMEHKFLNIEWKIFTHMLSTLYFTPSNNSTMSTTEHDSYTLATERERNKVVLQYIPVISRELLNAEVNDFKQKLKNNDFIRDVDDGNPDVQTAILDELLLTRLKTYMLGDLDKTSERVLGIKRTLQVLGESIKPPSTMGSVVSFLLCACLPRNLCETLIDIRNELSHFRSNSLHGHSSLDSDISYFASIREELQTIWKCFDVVEFTQKSRIENSLLRSYNIILKQRGISDNDIKAFENECQLRKTERKMEYSAYEDKLERLLVNVVSDLRYNLFDKEGNIAKDEFADSKVKAIEYIVGFITENNEDVKFIKKCNTLLQEVKRVVSEVSNITSDRATVDQDIDRILHDLQTGHVESDSNRCESLPHIEEFVQRIKKKRFTETEKSGIITAVLDAYDESETAYKTITQRFERLELELEDTEREDLLNKLLFPDNYVEKIRQSIMNRDSSLGMKYLEKKYPSRVQVEADIIQMLDDGSYIKNKIPILLKIAFQGNLERPYYTASLTNHSINVKVIDFIMNKASYFIKRLQEFEEIMIKEDKKIEEIYKWGQSKEIKNHKRFLMRRRYINETLLRASLEMGLLDCYNMLNEKEIKDMLEKSTHLFTEINLRNVTAHRCPVPETIGEMLDKNDFPSEIIDKILELIEDIPVVKAMATLFEISGKFDRESFKTFIDNNPDDKTENQKELINSIKKCKRDWVRFPEIIYYTATMTNRPIIELEELSILWSLSQISHDNDYIALTTK